MAGKGDTYRKVDKKKWDENWERAFGDKQTGKDTHHQMQKAYLRGKRKPLETTSINTKQ